MPEQEDYIVEAAQNGGRGISFTEKHSKRIAMYVCLIGILLINFGVLYVVRRRMKRETDQ